MPSDKAKRKLPLRQQRQPVQFQTVIRDDNKPQVAPAVQHYRRIPRLEQRTINFMTQFMSDHDNGRYKQHIPEVMPDELRARQVDNDFSRELDNMGDIIYDLNTFFVSLYKSFNPNSTLYALPAFALQNFPVVTKQTKDHPTITSLFGEIIHNLQVAVTFAGKHSPEMDPNIKSLIVRYIACTKRLVNLAKYINPENNLLLDDRYLFEAISSLFATFNCVCSFNKFITMFNIKNGFQESKQDY